MEMNCVGQNIQDKNNIIEEGVGYYFYIDTVYELYLILRIFKRFEVEIKLLEYFGVQSCQRGCIIKCKIFKILSGYLRII